MKFSAVLLLALAANSVMATEWWQTKQDPNNTQVIALGKKPVLSVANCAEDTALRYYLKAEKITALQNTWYQQASEEPHTSLYRWIYGATWLERLNQAVWPGAEAFTKVAFPGDIQQLTMEFPQSEQEHLAFDDVLVFNLHFAGFTADHKPDLRIHLDRNLSRVAGVADLDLALNHRLADNICVVHSLNQLAQDKEVELKIKGKTVPKLKISSEAVASQLCLVEIHQRQAVKGSLTLPVTQC
ncbi:MAG: hypothetical protein KJ556_03760 [Gammaproteobacteria bacterium]|nr:hypothetical protein [Gammaproteobacteria bacterium]MBU2056513.1 hypothetical protein [Gammaproteobacteria bacterium]MBU2174224.1 hypothetical protein [Gammaproteobacteria bacterium]MBU2248725.1 hypothetical protein [Gammaproteobacteria bacterium]MBU2344637.1 hypothetical protein [Gammaproteobacteria bacterium]